MILYDVYRCLSSIDAAQCGHHLNLGNPVQHQFCTVIGRSNSPSKGFSHCTFGERYGFRSATAGNEILKTEAPVPGGEATQDLFLDTFLGCIESHEVAKACQNH